MSLSFIHTLLFEKKTIIYPFHLDIFNIFVDIKKNIMGKFKFQFVLILFSSIAILFTGCINDGCMDPESINYSSQANHDNGDCGYIGSIVFFNDYSAAAYYSSQNINQLTYYANGVNLGSMDATLYWPNPSTWPDCGAARLVTADLIIDNKDSSLFTFECYDDRNRLLWSDDYYIHYKYCRKVRSSYSKSCISTKSSINKY